MVIKIFFTVLLASSALSKNLPRYADLDEEDQLLFRAAYDAPSYDHEEYQEPDEPVGKLDLLKDGMWALKTKMKELKVFDKALAANLLATKLQVKQLLGTLKKHQHVQVEKKKPVYHYQSPPAYHQYEAPHYSAPAPEHHYSPQYAPLQQTPPKYELPQSYGSPAPQNYDPSAHYESYGYNTPPKYDPPSHYESQSYVSPSHKYEPAPPKYEPVAAHYPQVHIEPHQYAAPPAAPVNGLDPYYGY